MLARNHPDRIRIAFDDHRLVANAGLLLPVTLGACPRIRSGRRNPPHSNLITAPQTFLWSYSYMVTPLETHIV